MSYSYITTFSHDIPDENITEWMIGDTPTLLIHYTIDQYIKIQGGGGGYNLKFLQKIDHNIFSLKQWCKIHNS